MQSAAEAALEPGGKPFPPLRMECEMPPASQTAPPEDSQTHLQKNNVKKQKGISNCYGRGHSWRLKAVNYNHKETIGHNQ